MALGGYLSALMIPMHCTEYGFYTDLSTLTQRDMQRGTEQRIDDMVEFNYATESLLRYGLTPAR
jgi:hypothetical protein